MGRINQALVAFNRGRVSPLSLARVDLEKIPFASEVQTNIVPRILGSASLRPGLGYVGSTRNNLKAYYLNFIYALSDQAELELTDQAMRVWINDAVLTRPAVTTAITNGTFDSNLTGWTDADESGAVSQWVTGGYMGLTGTNANSAVRTQTVTVSGGNINTEHGVRVKIHRGVVKFKIGSGAGLDDYVPEATLRAGEFSFGFTPSGNFHVTVSSTTTYESLVDSITVESSGAVVIPTEWTEAKLPLVRYDQSGDIIYVACDGIKQYKIERRATRSWGVAEYLSEDGPFRNANITPTTLTPSALTGNITLTASKPVFTTQSVGGLYKLTSTGQTVTAAISSDNTFTSSIRVTGVGGSRSFAINITGTWTATITLQRSIGEEGAWEDVSTYTTNTTTSFSDGLDNQIVFYRIGIKTSGYTSGTANTTLTYSLGTAFGVVRVTGYTSATSVSAIVLNDLGGTSATDDWEEGSWSPRRGYPSAVCFDEVRLWWAGRDNIYGSVSDAFESFDSEVEGDSGPIIRSLGSGPVDRINWLLPLLRLVIGAEMSEKVVRSSSLDEPLTPTVFNIRTPSTKGSSPIAPVKLDDTGLFVRNNRLFQLIWDNQSFDYRTADLTSYIPEIGGTGFAKLAVQRYIDTRVHCVKNDGTVAILVFDANEDVRSWLDITTDGFIEDVIVKPAQSGEAEDSVYYVVRRTINGNTVRYREKWALESECYGGTQNKQADSFVAGTQSSSATISGLSHLEGEEVIVWADGKCFSPRVNGSQTKFTVTSGAITLPSAVTSYVVGLPYSGQYKTTKLAYAAQGGTALLQSKRVEALGVIMYKTHNRGLRYGKSFDSLYEMPLIEQGKAVGVDHIWETYDERPFEFSQEFNTDSRLCLEMMAPMPCTLLGLVIRGQTNDRL